MNIGLHFTGGEPFLNYSLLVSLVKMASNLDMSSLFVETIAFWAISDDDTREKLLQLREAGLHGILVSVNSFILEYVPFERTLRAIRISRDIFRDNLIVYQRYFYHQFRTLDITQRLSFGDYVKKAGLSGLYSAEIIPMGRACYQLNRFSENIRLKDSFINHV